MPDLQGEIPDKPWQKQIGSFAIHSKGRNVFIFAQFHNQEYLSRFPLKIKVL